jgi:hypothetical protein
MNGYGFGKGDSKVKHPMGQPLFLPHLDQRMCVDGSHGILADTASATDFFGA